MAFEYCSKSSTLRSEDRRLRTVDCVRSTIENCSPFPAFMLHHRVARDGGRWSGLIAAEEVAAGVVTVV